MKRVGILGGTFDPIHYGHIELAKCALAEYALDEVRVMTGGNPPHKRDSKITSANTRYKMTELAFAGYDNIIPDSYEVNKNECSYTAKTMCELRSIHPDWEIYFIIGEDSLNDLPKWYEPQTVVDNCILLVYPRETNSDLDTLIRERKNEFGADIRKISANTINVSSTMIRNMAKNGEDISEFVPESVCEFIKKEGLYK